MTRSLSCRTVVYKGMMLVSQLRSFYDDLQDVRYASSMAMVQANLLLLSYREKYYQIRSEKGANLRKYLELWKEK